MKKKLIYLGDLVHNYISKGPFMFPINIGYISSYTTSLYGDDVDIRLFKFPGDLLNAIKKEKPDIIGLSNYTWNLDLNVKIMDYCKTVSPDILTVLGGPDYVVDKQDAYYYMKNRKSLDFYVLFQGEIGFSNIVKKYLDVQNIEEMKKSTIENCSFYDIQNDKLVVGENQLLSDINS